jgi:hypothetical protein
MEDGECGLDGEQCEDDPPPPPVGTPQWLAWLDLALSRLPLEDVLDLLPVNIRFQHSEVIFRTQLRTFWIEHEMEARVSFQFGTASSSSVAVFPMEDTLRLDTGTGYIQCQAKDGRIQVASNGPPVEGSIGDFSYSAASRGIVATNVSNWQSTANVQAAMASPTNLEAGNLQVAFTPSVSIKQTAYPTRIAMTAVGVGIVAGLVTAPEIFIPFTLREGWSRLPMPNR